MAYVFCMCASFPKLQHPTSDKQTVSLRKQFHSVPGTYFAAVWVLVFVSICISATNRKKIQKTRTYTKSAIRDVKHTVGNCSQNIKCFYVVYGQGLSRFRTCKVTWKETNKPNWWDTMIMDHFFLCQCGFKKILRKSNNPIYFFTSNYLAFVICQFPLLGSSIPILDQGREKRYKETFFENMLSKL